MSRHPDARAVNSSDPIAIATTSTTRTELKLDGESDELPEALRDRFEWIVAGNQVGIQWRRSHSDKLSTLCHVGDPSPANNQDCALRLWIGVSETTQELLVVMTQSVRLRPKRGKARRMFLVIPVENLGLGTSVAGFQPLALDQVPECLFERPSDRPSAVGNGFLHIRFALGPSRKSTVIMPARPHEGLVRGTALSLLDRLKSLSEAPVLDVYLRFNSYAQQKLLKLQRAATDNCDRLTCYTTPVFDVNAMYLGDRDGGFDLWAAQGCWQQQLDHSSTAKPRKRQASNLLETPPRYVPRDSARNPPTYDDCLDEPLTTRAQLTAADGPDQTPPPLEIIVPRSCTPVTRVEELLSQRSSVSRVCETPIARAKEAALVYPTPDLIVAPHVAVSEIALPGSVDTAATTSITVSAPEPTSVVPLITVSLPVHPSARFFNDMPEWLLRAWETSAVTHYTCIVPLLAMGYSARLGNVDVYEKSRARCTEHFVSWRAKAGSPVNVSTKMSLLKTLSYEIRDLVSWMLLLDPLADSGFFDSLINLESELQSVKDSLHAADDQLLRALKLADDEFDQRYTRLLSSKALIVVEVCFRYGPQAWKSRVDIAEKMSGQAMAILERDL
jgi:hypothetical protein